MTASISTVPTYPVPNYQAQVIFQPGDGGTNFIRVWATTAPEGTTLRKRIDDNKLNRALLYEGPGTANSPLRITFEKGGAYSLILQEYSRGNAWGGGYDGDPRGAPSETQLGAEQSHTLYVAQKMTQTLGVAPDTAELVVFVHNERIRATTTAVHGETTPAVINPSSDKAAAAAKDSGLLSSIAGAADDLVATFLDNIGSLTDTVINTYVVGHIVTGAYHQIDDNANGDFSTHYRLQTTATPAAAAELINKGRQRFMLHIQNATEASPTPGSVGHHDQSSLKMDLGSLLLPITADGGDPATVYAALADLARAIVRHAPGTMHETTDSSTGTGIASTIATSTLTDIHMQFLEALTVPAVSVIAGQSSGAVALLERGFEES